jgi:hypothetical protein
MSRAWLMLAGLSAFLAALAVMAVSAVACGGGGGGGKESTTLSTTLSGESKEGGEITVLEGAKVKDKASLSGKNASKATGKVKYAVYKESKCETLATAAGEGTVSGESVTASSEESLEPGKTYYWQATYEGNETNDASTSSCISEVLNVKASTSLSTKLSAGSEEGSEITVNEGTKIKDKATLSGTNSSSAGGKVLYKIFSDKECETLVKEAGEETVSSGSVPASSEEELEGGKTYYWQAVYKGDGLHEESTSSCGSEVLKVKAKTTLSTTLSGQGKEGGELTVLEGAKVKDRATVEGTNSSSAEGKVLYKVFSDSKCEHVVAELGEKSVSAGVATASNEEELEGGKTYYWQATYKGDALHQESHSECTSEVLNVEAKTTVATTLTGEGKEGTEVTVLEGADVRDAATLSGAKVSGATGTITYDVYSDNKCEDLVTAAGEVAVSGPTAPHSTEEKLSPGVYYWRASYSGDALNDPAKSACGTEISTIKGTTTLTTSLSGEGHTGAEITVGELSTVTDIATIGGSRASVASGTVKYDIYSDSKCEHLVTAAGEGSVSGGTAGSSSEQELPEGSYYWQAVYSGDANNEGSTSTCSSEKLTIKSATTLTTSLSGESHAGDEIEVLAGTAVTDSAKLTGASVSTAGGTVKYDVYSDSTCEHLVTAAGEGTVTSGSVPESNEEKLETGTYYWQATYSGDTHNEKSVSDCGSEVETAKTSTSLTTSLSGQGKEGTEINVDENSIVDDTATLSGTDAATATGTIAYKVYSDSECKHVVADAGEAAVTAGDPAESEEQSLAPGTYYWQAVYSGDETHRGSTSTCGSEIEIVKAATTLKTTAPGHESEELEVLEGNPVNDTATLQGAKASTATGTVKYDIYSDTDCKELVEEAGERTVSGESVPTSLERTLPIGTYYWQASYSGDTYNEKSESVCDTAIEKVVSPLATTLSGEEKSGAKIEVVEETPVRDSATLSGAGAGTATGTVKYDVYSDGKCEHLVTAAGEGTVSGGSFPKSSEETLAPGTYYWQATYSGDEHHPSATSTCGTEIEKVNEPLTTSLAGEGHSGGEIEVLDGGTAHDTATLNGIGAATAMGTVKYDVYSDAECEDLVTAAGEVSVLDGSIPESSEETLAPGIYYWQAIYSGDEHHHSATSTCGTEIDTVEEPLTTELAGEEHMGKHIEIKEAANAAHDTASLHGSGAGTATGTVKYKVYSDSKCEHLVAAAGEVTVTSGTIPASSEVKLEPGIYYWQAFYSGDEHHLAATSACGAEVEKVAAPWIVSLGDSFASGEAGRWAGNTESNSESEKVDALGSEAYFGAAPNGEAGGEAIPGCHRSKSAEIFIGGPVKSKNLACSGARTYSFFKTTTKQFKPGIDFENKALDEPLERGGNCPITKCEGQALQLEKFAKEYEVKMVALSIGGNNFGFGPIGRACVTDWLTSTKAIESMVNYVATKIVEVANAIPAPFGFGWVKERAVELAEAIAGQIRARLSFGPAFCSKEVNVTKVVEEEKAWLEKPKAEKEKIRAEEQANPARAKEGKIELEIQEAVKTIGKAMSNAGYAPNTYTIVQQNYPSPISEGEPAVGPPPAEGFRYSEESFMRQSLGGCGVWNEDANWLNKTMLPTMNSVVGEASEIAGSELQVKLMNESEAFKGHRLCELGVGLLGEVGLAAWNIKKAGEGPTRAGEEQAANTLEWVEQARLVPATLEWVVYRMNQVLEGLNWALDRVKEAQAFVERVPVLGPWIREEMRPAREKIEGVILAVETVKGWAEGAKSLVGGYEAQEAIHPNYWAQLALRNCLRQAYNSGAPKGGKCKIEGPGLTKPGEGGIPEGVSPEPKMKLE